MSSFIAIKHFNESDVGKVSMALVYIGSYLHVEPELQLMFHILVHKYLRLYLGLASLCQFLHLRAPF